MRIKELIRKIFKKDKKKLKANVVNRTRSNAIEGAFVEKEVPIDKVEVIEIEKVFEKGQLKNDKTKQRSTIPEAEMLGKKLVLNLPQSCQVKYIVLSSEAIVKQPRIGNTINLERDDMVFVISYENSEVCIKKYQVTDIEAQNNSIYTWQENLNHINQIGLYKFPQPVKRELKNFFYLVGKPNQIS